MSSSVQVVQQGGRVDIRLARPERKNALTGEMYVALSDALQAASADADVRLVLIRSDGDVFCAGNDLHDFLGGGFFREDAPVLRFLQTVAGFDKPLLVAVQGAAVGIGTTLLLHCDLVIASERAFFKMPFVQLGLAPEAGSSLLVPELVGQRRAFELLVLGDRMEPAEALRCGLVNQVVAPEALEEATEAMAARVMALPPGAVKASRALLRRASKEAVLETIRLEAGVFQDLLTKPEAAEAIGAALRRR